MSQHVAWKQSQNSRKLSESASSGNEYTASVWRRRVGLPGSGVPLGLACILNGSLKEPGLVVQDDLLKGEPDTNPEGCVGKGQVGVLVDF